MKELEGKGADNLSESSDLLEQIFRTDALSASGEAGPAGTLGSAVSPAVEPPEPNLNSPAEASQALLRSFESACASPPTPISKSALDADAEVKSDAPVARRSAADDADAIRSARVNVHVRLAGADTETAAAALLESGSARSVTRSYKRCNDDTHQSPETSSALPDAAACACDMPATAMLSAATLASGSSAQPSGEESLSDDIGFTSEVSGDLPKSATGMEHAQEASGGQRRSRSERAAVKSPLAHKLAQTATRAECMLSPPASGLLELADSPLSAEQQQHGSNASGISVSRGGAGRWGAVVASNVRSTARARASLARTAFEPSTLVHADETAKERPRVKRRASPTLSSTATMALEQKSPSGGFFSKVSPVGAASLRPSNGTPLPMSKVLLMSRLATPAAPRTPGPSPAKSDNDKGPAMLTTATLGVPSSAAGQGAVPATPAAVTVAMPVESAAVVHQVSLSKGSVGEVSGETTPAATVSEGSEGPSPETTPKRPRLERPQAAPPPTIGQQLAAINSKINDHHALKAVAAAARKHAKAKEQLLQAEAPTGSAERKHGRSPKGYDDDVAPRTKANRKSPGGAGTSPAGEKRPRGRPPTSGSLPTPDGAAPVRRGRGRPKGSTNAARRAQQLQLKASAPMLAYPEAGLGVDELDVRSLDSALDECAYGSQDEYEYEGLLVADEEQTAAEDELGADGDMGLGMMTGMAGQLNSASRKSEYAHASIDEAGLSEILAWDLEENDDPLGLLYLEPGSIEPMAAAPSDAGTAVEANAPDSATVDVPLARSLDVTSGPPAVVRTGTLDMEASAVSQLRELSVLCGEDPADILREAEAAQAEAALVA